MAEKMSMAEKTTEIAPREIQRLARRQPLSVVGNPFRTLEHFADDWDRIFDDFARGWSGPAWGRHWSGPLFGAGGLDLAVRHHDNGIGDRSASGTVNQQPPAQHQRLGLPGTSPLRLILSKRP